MVKKTSLMSRTVKWVVEEGMREREENRDMELLGVWG